MRLFFAVFPSERAVQCVKRNAAGFGSTVCFSQPFSILGFLSTLPRYEALIDHGSVFASADHQLALISRYEASPGDS